MSYPTPEEFEQAVRTIISYTGDDPLRPGLVDTPGRVRRSFAELFGGYNEHPAEIIKTFNEEGSDELVLLKGVRFTSFCEHHLLPFVGIAHMAYIPNGRIIGLSKLARLLEIYARRLQIQERLCTQVTAALDEHLRPLGSACVIEASHLCVSCRGVQKQDAVMVTSSLTGVFRQPEVRAEFFGLVRS